MVDRIELLHCQCCSCNTESFHWTLLFTQKATHEAKTQVPFAFVLGLLCIICTFLWSWTLIFMKLNTYYWINCVQRHKINQFVFKFQCYRLNLFNFYFMFQYALSSVWCNVLSQYGHKTHCYSCKRNVKHNSCHEQLPSSTGHTNTRLNLQTTDNYIVYKSGKIRPSLRQPSPSMQQLTSRLPGLFHHSLIS